MTQSPPILEAISVTIPAEAAAAYEAALAAHCRTVATLIEDEARKLWRVEGIKARGENDSELHLALALAAAATGATATPTRHTVETEGWLARVSASFPEQRIGTFRIRGTHLPPPSGPGRRTLTLDAGLAFGSGEHASTRGCLLALERTANRRPRRILDMGTGSGILALAAATTLHRPVLAIDNDPWAIRVTRENARLNRVHPRLRAHLGNGWQTPGLRGRRYDLVFANILARPLARMAADLARHLAPGGTAILAGLLRAQERSVLAAHRRHGLRLRFRVREEEWTTLVLGK